MNKNIVVIPAKPKKGNLVTSVPVKKQGLPPTVVFQLILKNRPQATRHRKNITLSTSAEIMNGSWLKYMPMTE